MYLYKAHETSNKHTLYAEILLPDLSELGLICLYHPDCYQLFTITLCNCVFVQVPAEKQPCQQVCHLWLLIQSRFLFYFFTFLTVFFCFWNFWGHFLLRVILFSELLENIFFPLESGLLFLRFFFFRRVIFAVIFSELVSIWTSNPTDTCEK